MNLKLFRNKWLAYLFELEILLIISILISFLVMFVMGPAKESPVFSARDMSGLFEKYRLFSSVLNMPFSGSGEVIPGEEIKDPFVRSFLTLKTAGEELKNRSYGIIDDFIRDFKSDDPYLNYEKDKLHLKNLYVKKLYPRFIKGYRLGKYGFDYDIMLLLSYLSEKDNKNALAVFEELYLTHPIRSISDHLPGKDLTRLLNASESGFWNRKLEKMIETGRFSEFSRISRYIKDRQLKNYISAEISYSRKRYSRARAFLSGVRSPRFKSGKEKLLLKMRIREDDFTGIDGTLEKLMSDTGIYRRLLLDISSILLIKGELELSSRYFMRYIDFLKGDGKDRSFSYWNALWVTAWLKVKSGDEAGAAAMFREGSRSTIIPYRIANSFWDSLYNGEHPEKIREFPFTYYFARYSSMGKPVAGPDTSYFIRKFNKKSSPLFTRLMSKTKTLLRYGLSGEAIDYLSWMKDNIELPPEDMNALKMVETLIHLKRGDHYHTFVSFRNNFADYEKIILPNFLREIYMPMKYRDLVRKYSRKQGVSPELVLALIKRESMFRKDIISPAKAKGLMQMIDETAYRTARSLGIRLRRNDIYRPEINIRLGVAHLKELLDRYDGKIYLALAAYNAGVHRVTRWLAEFGDFDEKKFIEMIPFSETRNYVKNVLRNYYYYTYYYKPAERGKIKI